VGSRKNGNPKKDLRPPFFGSFFGRAKNEQINLEEQKNRPKGARRSQMNNIIVGKLQDNCPATPASWLLTKNTHRVFY
jgi:hypothetical protein